MLILNQTNFQKEVLDSKRPVLVDFFGTWCPPCKMLAPILEELDQAYKDKIKIAKLDIDQSVEIAQNYNVMSVPTLIFFKNGKEVKRLVGLQAKEEIKKQIEKLV